MSTFLTKLKRRFERDRGVPISLRIRDDAWAAARYMTHAASAQLSLQACDKVGSWARTAGGRPVIDNRGRIELGAHVLLTSAFSPVQLTTGPEGSIEIGDGTIVNFGTVIAAQSSVKIGSGVSFGPYCIVSDNAVENPAYDGDRGTAAIEIGDGAWLAGRVTVLPGTRIGAGTVITAGSIVSGEIPAGVLAGGNPARILRKIAPGDDLQGASPGPAIADIAGYQGLNGSGEHHSYINELIGHGGHSDLAGNGRRNGSARLDTHDVTHLAQDRLLLDVAQFALPAPVEQDPTDDLDARAETEARPAPTHRALIISDSMVDELAARLADDPEFPTLSAEAAPFGQVVPTLLALSSSQPLPDLVMVWTRPEASVPSFQRVLAFEHVDEAVLLSEVDTFASLLADALRDVKCAVIPTWTLPAYNRGWGLMDARKGGATHALWTMNLRLMERLDALPNVHVLNAQRWVDSVGVNGQHPKLWYMGKIAFHADVFAEAVKDTKAALRAVLGGSRKLIVVDLDDTLWGGVVGDAGWENLRLGGHDSLGESFVDFQHALKNLKRRGIMLAIVSKNEANVALEAIRSHSEMVLREDDFVGHRINWSDKARNIVELSVELNIGLQSIVFIDDNPVERARVRDALPEVLVPEWPEDKLLYASTLRNLHCFDTPSLSREDSARTEMYAAQRMRMSMMPEVGSIEDWLRSLDVTVKARRLDAASATRAAQLLNKTNQLNLSTRRLGQNELVAWAAEPNHELWVVDVSDKLGDSGLTGIVSIEIDGATARIADFLLSCRVMGRKVEETLVHIAIEAARRRGLSRVEALYQPTAKNKPCLDFWVRSGLRSADKQTFVWDASLQYPCPDVITLISEGVDA